MVKLWVRGSWDWDSYTYSTCMDAVDVARSFMRRGICWAWFIEN